MDEFERWLPGLASLQGYTRYRLRIELVAAVAVWAAVVPQALAYGRLAGMPAAAGLATAFAGMLLYGIFGTSRYLNVGPEVTSAIVTAVAVAPLAAGSPARATALAALLALLTGVALTFAATLRLDAITRLLPPPILLGYLAGAAVVIVIAQLPSLLGIPALTLRDAVRISPWDAGIGLATIAVILAARGRPRLPAGLVALAGATLVAAVAPRLGVHAIRVLGPSPRGLGLSLPSVLPTDVLHLAGPAVCVALLVSASSVATGAAMASRDGEDVGEANELMGLAAANLGAGVLSGFPASASGSRSLVGALAGSRAQTTHLACAVLVLATMALIGPALRYVPVAALAGIVLMSAARLVDVSQFQRLWRAHRVDLALAGAALACVLVFGVLLGIAAAVAIALLEVMRHAIAPSSAVLGRAAGGRVYRDVEHHEEAETAPGVVVYRFDAPLFFANAPVFRAEILELVARARPAALEVIVSAEGITDMDVVGAETVGRLLDELNQRGIRLALARVRPALLKTLWGLGLEERIGTENIFQRVDDAVRAFQGRSA